MPSRFSFFKDEELVKFRFELDEIHFEFWQNYNIKPTNKVIGLVNEDGYKVVKLRWGYVKGNQFFKARGETIHEKKLFRRAFQERRCIIFSDGFFEWKKEEKKSIPYYFKLKNGGMFTIGGVYNSFEDDEGVTQYQFSIITVEANELVRSIFHRMPAMLTEEYEKVWLSEIDDIDTLLSLLQPFDASLMESYEVESLPSRGDRGVDTIRPKPIETGLDDFF